MINKLNGYIFCLKVITYWKNLTLFGKKAVVILKKEFDSMSVYNKKLLKTKIKSYGDELTDLYDKEIPKVESNHTCIVVISLDSALKKEKSYFPNGF